MLKLNSTMSSFNSAAQKLAAAPTPYPLEDLPQDNNDDAWTVIRSEYGLSLPELVALKNYELRQQQQQQQTQSPLVATQYLHWRMWAGDNETVFKVPALSFEGLCSAVRDKFDIPISEAFSLYFIPNKRDVNSIQYIASDVDLNNLLGFAGRPTVFIWNRGDPSMSPNSIPSEVEIHALSVGDESSQSASSTRGYVQDLFRKGVRARDSNTCVLSGTKLRPKTGNVQAAHILGVEKSLEAARSEGGVFNPYDTSNGMLLESSLHLAFDSFQWCMDEFLNVHVTEVGKANGLGKYEGKRLNLQVGVTSYPTKQTLRVRFDLFKKIVKDRQSRITNRERGRRRFVDAFTL